MVCGEVVGGVVVFMLIVVIVLLRDLDLGDAHNVYRMLGEVGDHGLWFY